MADILDDPQASRALEYEASRLAHAYPGADEERLVSVLARTASDIHGRPFTQWPKAEQAADSKLKLLPPIWFFPTISEALRHLSPEEALALFESADLERLRVRQLYTSYLGSGDAPLFTVKQCATQINGLLRHQQKNRGDLVETGYPRTVFKGSALLTPQLVELYPVKWPSEVLEDGDEYLYAWEASWKEGGPQCDYEDAPLAPGLSIKDAARLESLRDRLYDARAEVLGALVLCLRGDDPEALWRDTKAALTKHLSADEAYFLLEMDRSLESYEYVQPRSPLTARGALTALLGLVGHCEKELTIGTMAKARGALGDLIRKDGRGRPHLRFGSYFEVVGTPEQKEVVDSACDMLAEHEEREVQFWGDYEERVNGALGEEFETEVHVTKLVRPGYESKHRSTIETFGMMPLMNKYEVGRILSIPPKSVMNLRRDGELPGCIVGKKPVRFHPDDVAKFIERARKAPETEEDDD